MIHFSFQSHVAEYFFRNNKFTPFPTRSVTSLKKAFSRLEQDLRMSMSDKFPIRHFAPVVA